MASLIGSSLGKYQVIDQLGQGGMATVYKGYQPDVDRYVAIKVLPPHPGQDPHYIERFRLEARTIARLQHPHILPVYDYGNQDDILYLVMAYVEGGSLHDLIDSGPMPFNRVERLLRDIASALDYAHRRGVIHRDIKPGNILLDSEGHALLADFGIVKITEGGTNLTGTGGVVGTPAYIAPEQGRGSEIDARADIYSLGVVVYEMLTGQQPYIAVNPMQIIIKHMNDPVPYVSSILPSVPPALDDVMQRVLAKEPEERFQTATEFADAFSRAIHRDESYPGVVLPMADATALNESRAQPTEVSPTPYQPMPTVILQQSTNPLILLGGFALIALVIVIAVVVIVTSSRQGAPDAATPVPPTVEATQQAAVPTPRPVPNFGTLTFTMSKTPGDTIQLQVKDLTPLQGGERYVAWLQNTADASLLPLGPLTLDAFGSGSLTFVDENARNLSAFFNALVISREPTGSAAQPSDNIPYSGSVPTELTAALREIMVESAVELPPGASASTALSEDYTSTGPANSSLLAGAISEAQTAAQHTGLAARATNLGGLRTHAEHTINILLGTQDDYNGNGRGENPGRKVGLPFYLDRIETLLEAATSAPTAGLRVQSDGELIRVCLQNVRGWMDQVIDLEKELLAAEDIKAVDQQKADSTRLAQAILDGMDLNGNGTVEPFEGECGLKQIETYGVLAASIELVQGPPAAQ